TPDARPAAFPLLANPTRLRGASPSVITVRAESAKALGNIAGESPVVVAELLRLLKEDSESGVRTEAAHALGKIGERAETASRALAAVISDPDSGDVMRA